MSTLFYKMDELEIANEINERAISMSSDSGLAASDTIGFLYRTRGVYLRKLGRAQEALTSFETAKSIMYQNSKLPSLEKASLEI